MFATNSFVTMVDQRMFGTICNFFVCFNAYACHEVRFVAKFIWSRTYFPKSSRLIVYLESIALFSVLKFDLLVIKKQSVKQTFECIKTFISKMNTHSIVRCRPWSFQVVPGTRNDQISKNGNEWNKVVPGTRSLLVVPRVRAQHRNGIFKVRTTLCPNEVPSFLECFSQRYSNINNSSNTTIAQQKFLRLFVLFCDIFHIAKNVRKSPKFCCDIDKYRKKGQKNLKFLLRY